MTTQDPTTYNRIAKAIDYIQSNYQLQPSLDEIAEQVHLSPFHFQRLFTEWAGVSPKKFLQYISLSHAKSVLQQNASLMDAVEAAGLSGSGRLHDLFINIEGMTPGEYKNGGQNLAIQYTVENSPFGEVFVASTPQGICQMTFIDTEPHSLERLKKSFPNANITEGKNTTQENALKIFTEDWSNISQVKLHLKGTDFQLKVWESLLHIPMGQLCTYGTIAQQIHQPSAARAVGTAIGSNPIAYLIPCHRVIQQSGKLGGYMWGETRKSAIIGWEASKRELSHL
ncbi:bifunctional transcriptional activator/DNA repair enzyme AdaA [Cellulophaga sp. BC115SP]|uniref:bifunctional transcriptional activator/DNA repair enzyme AdaA n=1 Tax=Cellulophaga sp. BC115SP TaxID=2683263 RepID=UPI001412F28D|nr:methylated-DNA--[protein]-cysteine S-methyltransferase [Cellulophaga sp. BC115SP]NBB29096.1 methylated-DNA--[protein]-cysteine S-methyltransferase [Cellulophaga sp. BC115SP]